MAGVYPDVPSHRMAWERDGTVLVGLDSNRMNPTIRSATERQYLNDENNSTLGGTMDYTMLLFPELRDIVGYVAGGSSESQGQRYMECYTSPNTTNGVDGTWTQRVGHPTPNATTITQYRNITAVSWLGIIAVGFRAWENYGGYGPLNYATIHLYGGPSAGLNPNRLRLWHPTSDAEVGPAYFDWGDIRQGTSQDRTFRVRNNSATLTANTITVSLDAPTNTTPPVPGQFLLEKVSAPGFTATVQIPTLVPGATSEIITMRRNTPTNAVMSLWWARVLASAATWT